MSTSAPPSADVERLTTLAVAAAALRAASEALTAFDPEGKHHDSTLISEAMLLTRDITVPDVPDLGEFLASLPDEEVICEEMEQRLVDGKDGGVDMARLAAEFAVLDSVEARVIANNIING